MPLAFTRCWVIWGADRAIKATGPTTNTAAVA
ncbi:hypothetical protein YPPY94_1827, partial [Yersinia pestis PY-94]